MERHEIEAFLTLADELHFGRAAERLRVSTARVSQTIKKLERQVGATLFDRTSRRVALTPLGKQLRDDWEPAYRQVREGLERAVAAGRGIDGVLRTGFVSAAAGGLVLRAVDLLHDRHPGCAVEIREVQVGDCLAPLRTGHVDVLLAGLPLSEPDLATGPVLISEPRLLAVSARHPFARRASVSVEDLARDRVLRAPCAVTGDWEDSRVPRETPGGRPIERGQATATFNEALALIAAGKGVYPVGAHVTRYYARPDIAYIPFRDAEPLHWGLVWRATGETARVRAFAAAARDVVASRDGPAHGWPEAHRPNSGL